MKALASSANDTLLIADYWAINEQPPLQASAEVKGDSIIIQYDTLFGPANDWNPTVEALLYFTATSVPPVIHLRINAVSGTLIRPPDSLELSLGFRNARQVLIKQILLISPGHSYA